MTTMSKTAAVLMAEQGLSESAAYERATLLAGGRAALVAELRDAARARDPVGQQKVATVLRSYDEMITDRYSAATQAALELQSLSVMPAGRRS